MPAAADNYQARFALRWGHLVHAHVRALAWLLDAPGLLDADDPQWQGKVATLAAPTLEVARWLARLDADPSALDGALGPRVHTRLGLYAEKLMAFYFREHGQLVAHGLQVRASRNDTIGEFDFLLEAGPDALEHIEFATKFYLLAGEGTRVDSFVGPNLADSLGAKMRKIMERQLALAAHPAAQAVLPRPVARARALVKGWLFYPGAGGQAMAGIEAAHCRGFWCALGAVGALAGNCFVVLPRLQWLAPYRACAQQDTLDRAGLQAALSGLEVPALVAVVGAQDGAWIELERGFIVPDDWRARAAQAGRSLANS
ncbi:MAG: DUF1853 family protein [Pseudomonadota bacterium]